MMSNLVITLPRDQPKKKSLLRNEKRDSKSFQPGRFVVPCRIMLILYHVLIHQAQQELKRMEEEEEKLKAKLSKAKEIEKEKKRQVRSMYMYVMYSIPFRNFTHFKHLDVYIQSCS